MYRPSLFKLATRTMSISSQAKPKVAAYFAMFQEGKPQPAGPVLTIFDETFSKDFKIDTAQGEKNFEEWRAVVEKMAEGGMKIT